MRDLRIVFMGTPEFAVASLRSIVEAGFNVVGVLTAPDKPAGRGRKLQESAVKKYAVENNLRLLQPLNLKAPEFLEELKELKPNLQVVVAFRMLPQVVWQLPEYGTFNLHASLLPKYRGAAPINWAIINGETQTGVSTFFIDEKIDTGEMILQESLAIDPLENAGALHDKLMKVGAGLVVETVERIQKGPVQTIPQKETETLSPAHKLNKDNTRIDWNWPLEKIFNFIRGLSPYPAAWSLLQNDGKELQVKIYTIEKEVEEHAFPPGEIILEGKSIKVTAEAGFIKLLEVQFPGKRKMAVKDLLNGYQFSPDAKML